MIFVNRSAGPEFVHNVGRQTTSATAPMVRSSWRLAGVTPRGSSPTRRLFFFRRFPRVTFLRRN